MAWPRLATQPAASTLADLQTQLDRFRDHYNNHRPHRALGQATPAAAYQATIKALPATSQTTSSHYRIRYDRVSKEGKLSLRRAGKMHHLGVGATHQGKRVLALIDETTVTVIHLDTGEILATNQIQPNRNYWRNTTKPPGRWPAT